MSDGNYEMLVGNDVERDVLYLELTDVTIGTPEVLFYAEKSADGGIRVLTAAQPGSRYAPLEVMERFLSEARKL